MISNIDGNKIMVFEFFIIIPKMIHFRDHNLKLHEMIDIHLKYDNLHKNDIFYA